MVFMLLLVYLLERGFISFKSSCGNAADAADSAAAWMILVFAAIELLGQFLWLFSKL